MADPKYVQVKLDDNIADGAVLTYDAKTDTITDSGMSGSQGELRANAGSINVGLQTMSSAGEQVVWQNQDSKVNYAPPWHVIDEINEGGSSDRYYKTLNTVTRFAIKTDVLENPVFDVYVPIEEVVFRLKMTFPEAHNDVEFKVTHAGHEMWREIKNVNAGDNEIILDMPIAFHAGSYEFSIRPYTTPGVGLDMVPPVKVMGDAQTGKVGYDVVYREFSEVPLATKDYVDTAVAGGVGTDLMTKAVYDTDNDGIVDIADNVEGVTTAGNDKYYGTDDKGAVGFHQLPAGIDISTLESRMTTAEGHIDTNKASTETNKAEIDKHGTAITNHGAQIAKNTSDIATNTANVKVAMQHSQSAMNEGLQNRKNAVNSIVTEVSNIHKTITLKLMSQTGLVDSALIDLSSWFASGPQPQPGDDHKIYYGFTVKTTLPEAEIIRIGTSKEVSTINSLDVVLTRSSTTPSYMWIWLPDAAGTIKGFDFSGFVSTWNDTAINVAGVDGKLYVSPNKTSATSIEFEVKV